jgi:HSP20 family protein
LAETDTHYEVKVDLPGMKAEDVQVELKDGALWISGKVEEEHEERNKTYHRVERRFGEFHRTLALPAKWPRTRWRPSSMAAF